MTTGLKASIANAILAALTGEGVDFAHSAAFYAKLHTGDPGAAGTTNPAANTTREAATFGAPSAGSIATSADLDWPSVPNAETYTHVSFWDASAAGNFICSVALTAPKTVAVGDDFKIPSGSLTVSLGTIAA